MAEVYQQCSETHTAHSQVTQNLNDVSAVMTEQLKESPNVSVDCVKATNGTGNTTGYIKVNRMSMNAVSSS